jgi:hypothetical protein
MPPVDGVGDVTRDIVGDGTDSGDDAVFGAGETDLGLAGATFFGVVVFGVVVVEADMVYVGSGASPHGSISTGGAREVDESIVPHSSSEDQCQAFRDVNNSEDVLPARGR